MRFFSNIHSVTLALLGCAGILTFYCLNSSSKPVKILQPQISKYEVLQKAKSLYQKSNLADIKMRRTQKVSIDDDLFVYAQQHFNLPDLKRFFPVAIWEIEWSGIIQSKKEGARPAKLSIKFDFNGNLVGFHLQNPAADRLYSLKDEEATELALKYLTQQFVDTTGLSITDKVFRQNDQSLLEYKFTFSKGSPLSGDLVENYEVDVVGNRVLRYQAGLFVDELDNENSNYHNQEVGSKMLSLLLWLLTGVLGVYYLFKKLRHDELEFKRGRQIGVFAFIVTWTLIALRDWHDWQQALLGGGLVGVFTGIGIMLAYSVADSLNREAQPSQYALLDVLWRGFLRVRELGESFLKALFIAGISLAGVGLLTSLASSFGVGYIEFNAKAYEVFYSREKIIAMVLSNLTTSLAITLMLFSLLAAELGKRIQNSKMLIMTFAFLLNLANIRLFDFQPAAGAFLLFMPISVFWVYSTLKQNVITIFIAVFIWRQACLLLLLPNVDDVFLSFPGLVFCLFIIAILVVGILLSRSQRSVKEFADYVPSYVSRIAERERQLKELEIARGVQTRFLPQSIPQFSSLDIACICKPAMEVGGDYYDFMLNGNNSLGVIIGDVSGKGVSAAFYMTMVKGIIKTLSKSITNPVGLLSEMNCIFYENVPKDVFVSVIYGEFDLENNLLRFARAGHNPLLYFQSKDAQIKLILPKGMAIGLEKGPLFKRTIEEVQVPFSENDIFVFFTDGISETVSKSGEEFGDRRLSEVIRNCSGQTSAELTASIVREVALFSNSAKQHDDLTMVVVKIGDLKSQEKLNSEPDKKLASSNLN